MKQSLHCFQVIWKDKTLGPIWVFQHFSTIIVLFVRHLKQENSRPMSMTLGNQNRDFGVAFGDILWPLGTLWSSETGLWTPWGAFWRPGPILRTTVNKKPPSFWRPCWHPKSKKSQRTQNTVSRKQCRKSVLPELARNGKKGVLYWKYNMFRELGHPQVMWLLVSF